MLPSKGRKHARPATCCWVLVRPPRNDFAYALVRGHWKARGVPVAGLDRLVLTDQPAVADLLSLCDTLLLPEDDLSLACVLTSPLGGLNDEDLMELAAMRRGTLWEALRERAPERGHWRLAHEFIATLLARVDYASPRRHALLSRGARACKAARAATRFPGSGRKPRNRVDEPSAGRLADLRQDASAASLQGFVH